MEGGERGDRGVRTEEKGAKRREVAMREMGERWERANKGEGKEGECQEGGEGERRGRW